MVTYLLNLFEDTRMNQFFSNLINPRSQTIPFYQRRRVQMTNALLLIMATSMSIMCVLNALVFKDFALAAFDALAAAVPMYTYFRLQKHQNIEWASWVGALSIFFVSTGFISFNQNMNFGLIWVIFLPIFAMTLVGVRHGLYLSIVYFIYIVSIAFWGVGVWQNGDWNVQSSIRLTTALAALIIIIYSYEHSLFIYQKREEEQRRKLEILSTQDFLTGLHNRGHITAILNDEFERAQRYDSTFTVAILDLDDFKKINDTYGHNVGDEVLKKISRGLQDHLRKTESIGRWGGEEFLVLFPNTQLAEALAVCQKLSQTIQNIDFGEVNSVTTCIGVCEYAKEHSLTKLIAQADKALYQGKREGKNKVLACSSAL